MQIARRSRTVGAPRWLVALGPWLGSLVPIVVGEQAQQLSPLNFRLFASATDLRDEQKRACCTTWVHFVKFSDQPWSEDLRPDPRPGVHGQNGSLSPTRGRHGRFQLLDGRACILSHI